MEAFVESLLRRLGHDPRTFAHLRAVELAAMVMAALVAINFAAISAGIFSWAERRIAARMQSRVGPNRVGPAGFFQWIADAVKLLLKEDLIPDGADLLLFKAAPYLLMMGFACLFVALPFSHRLVVADLDVGAVYLLAVGGLSVIAILLAGFSSNSKWSLFGALRSAAQIVSYEIPAGLGLLTPILLAGTLSMQGLVRAQGGWPWQWFVFDDPAAACSFFLYFISALAEGNRTPFDLPEAESELVAGYNTEYSGMRFSFFFLVEWGHLWVMSAIATTAFLGGWQLPGAGAAWLDRTTAPLADAMRWHLDGPFALACLVELASLVVFAAKVLTLVFVVIWIRWSLPRVRLDQLLALCWKTLIPLGLGCVLFTAGWMLMARELPWVATGMHALLFTGSVGLAIAFGMQVAQNLRRTGDRATLRGNW